MIPGARLIVVLRDPVERAHSNWTHLWSSGLDPVGDFLQACAQEDIPAETGWLSHGGVWNYNAPFVSHVYLWAGLKDWAGHTFTGFLNHASPLYCWRAEQPLRGSPDAE